MSALSVAVKSTHNEMISPKKYTARIVCNTPLAADEITGVSGAGLGVKCAGHSLCVTGEVTLIDKNEAREMRNPKTPWGQRILSAVMGIRTVIRAPGTNCPASPRRIRRAPGASPVRKTMGMRAMVERMLL